MIICYFFTTPHIQPSCWQSNTLKALLGGGETQEEISVLPPAPAPDRHEEVRWQRAKRLSLISHISPASRHCCTVVVWRLFIRARNIAPVSPHLCSEASSNIIFRIRRNWTPLFSYYPAHVHLSLPKAAVQNWPLWHLIRVVLTRFNRT